MTPNSNNDAIARFATLANVVTVATSKMSALSVQLVKAGAASELAASKIASLARSATQLSLGCQAVAQCCHCDQKPTPSRWQTATIFANVTAQTFLTGTAILAGAEILGKVLRRLQQFSWLALVKDKLMSALRWTLSLGRGVIESEAVSAALESLADVVAALATTETVLLTAFATAGAAILVGTSYLLWRHWNAVVRAIRKLCSVVVNGATEFVDKFASAVGEVVGLNSERMPRHPKRQGTNSNVAPSGNRFPYENLVAGSLIPVVPSLKSLAPPAAPGFRTVNAAVRTAAAAMFMTPLLVTPASADIASVQPRTEMTRTASVAIHSSPAITINASNCEDIEQRVLEALRKHREELYAQFCNELQRRQRTEF